MDDPELLLRSLGYELPPPPQPVGSYLFLRQYGNLWVTSGVLPMRDGKLLYTGQVGRDCSLEKAQEAALLCLLNLLSLLKQEFGALRKVQAIVRLEGYIASAPDFYEQPLVLNPASELLQKLWGETGRHTRIAIGTSSLPKNAPVELCLWGMG